MDRVADSPTPLELLRPVLDPVRLSVPAASVRGQVSVQELASEVGLSGIVELWSEEARA